MEDQEREAAIDAEQDDELDLNLGLRMAPRRRSLHLPNLENPAVSDDWSDLSLTTSIWGKGGTRSEKEWNRLGLPELRAKMEAQALRRQEARRKRDDKRKSKANAMAGNANERLLWFESRRAAGRESEGGDSERRRKGGNCNDNGAEGGTAATTSFSVRSAGEFDRSQLNVLPCLIIPGLAGSDGDAIQPVVGVGVPGAGELRPYQVEEKNSGLVGGGVSDQLKRSVSSCSRGSSSGVSDYQSTSGQGGSSSDGGSHSSHSYPLDLTIKNCPTMSNDTQIHTFHHNSQPSAPQLNDSTSTNSINGKADRSFSSYQIEPTQILKRVPSQTNSSHHDQSQTSPGKKPMPTRRTRSPCQVTNGHKLDLSKPPKPKGHQSNGTVLLPNMPCVTTTGNGPNGKRITGFLYKYTNLEVSIVCICHGTSFSPTGFVEHAGGVGIENPLRHITISPSSSN